MTKHMQKSLLILALWSCLIPSAVAQPENLASGNNGSVHFRSEAPLELIEASSNKVQSVVDLNSNKFAFSVSVQTFEGFNAPLQKQHFNENYMETHKFPIITFSGHFIEDVDLEKDGIYQLRQI